MTTATSFRITGPEPRHEARWRVLFQGYADFYKVPIDEGVKDRVWGWLTDPSHVLNGIFAEDAAGDLVGIAHVRAMPRPLSGNEVGFLDDLYVDPTRRGSGIVGLLFEAIRDHARARGWPAVRWLTQEFNYRARTVYDREGEKTPFILYGMTIEPRPQEQPRRPA